MRSVLSLGAEGEVIRSTDQDTVLLKGRSAQRALEERRPEQSRDSFEVLADINFSGSNREWTSAHQLADAISDGQRRTYVLCARYPWEFFRFLQSGSQFAEGCIPVLFYGARVVVGPEVRSSDRLRQVADLMLANLPSLRARVLRRHRIVSLDPPQLLQRWRCVQALWQCKSEVETVARGLIVDFSKGTAKWESVYSSLPPAKGTHEKISDVDDLVSSVFGWVTAVGTVSGDWPLCVMTAKSRVVAEAQGTACALRPEEARRRAIAECAERIVAARAGRGEVSRIQCYASIENTPSLEALQPFSRKQYQDSGFPYVPLRENDVAAWSPGVHFRSGASVWLPSRLATLDEEVVGPRFAPLSSTGMAAGTTVQEASNRGLLELFERDVLMRSWFSDRVLRLEPGAWSPQETERLQVAGFEVRAGVCQTELGPLVVVFISHRSSGLGAYGCAASTHLQNAISHALSESVQMYAYRSKKRSLLPVSERWRRFDMVAQKSDLTLKADIDRLARHYDPVVVDLLSPFSNFKVVSLWSAEAVDFSDRRQPPPLNRWDLDNDTKAAIAEFPGFS